MSENRLISPYILDHKDESNYAEKLQEHSDAERIAFVDETFVEPSYDKDTGILHPGYYSVATVVVEADDIAKFREDFASSFGGINYWHTTDAANNTARKRQKKDAEPNLRNSP